MSTVRSFVATLGPAGVVAIGILMFCLPFYYAAIRPMEIEAARMKQSDAARSRPPAAPPARDFDGFYASFPPREALLGELERLHAHARASNLRLAQGDYLLEARAIGLSAYRVTLPVRGSYADVRTFVSRVLAGMPAVSLDALRFERKKALDGLLDAQLRFTLYLRPGKDGAGT